VRAAIASAASTATPNQPLRVLEIGAGTGGTTSAVLPAIAADRVRYCFTDVGPLFLTRAGARFAGYPFMDFRQLDIEKHPREQGFAAHAFDVVVAANVLHATRDLHATLEHVAWLLGPAGMLVLYEATNHPTWFDVTTGLIGGWQRFQDDIRTDVPLVSPDVWESALLGHGFREVRAFPERGSAAAILGQHVMIGLGADVAADAGERAVAPEARGVPRGSESDDVTPNAPESASAFRARLEALPQMERRETLIAFVCDHVVRILRLDPSRPPDRQQRLMDLGIDSLMAVEFRNALAVGLGVDKKLPATLIFDRPTPEAVADYLLHQVLGFADAVQEPLAAADSDIVDRMARQLEDLDDEEVGALLEKRLENL
jgi:hypothetical protein